MKTRNARGFVVLTSMAFGFAAVLARLAWLQVWCHEPLRQRAESQASRWVREAPRRGPILDHEGNPFVESQRVGACFADPTLIARPEAVAARLSPLLEVPASEIVAKIRKAPGSFVWLKRDMPVEKAQKVERENILGVGFKWEYKRVRLDDNLAASLVGFVGTDGKGLSGLELTCERWLAEPAAPHRTFKDGRGGAVGADSPQEARPYVRLTLDRMIQYVAERELEWGMARSQAKAGLIVVQDPRTGDILALANRVRGVTADTKANDSREMTIPAAQWVFEPGSTFKVVTAAAALEEKQVKLQELIDCENGHWRYRDITINDHKPEKIISFARAMEMSSNIGLAKVGLRLGKEKYYDYARAFGFGARTGSGVPGESPGLLRPFAKWSGVTLPTLSFGQEVGVTALQLACAYSALANGGELLEPRLFMEARDASGAERKWERPSVVRRVVSPETAAALRQILEGVVLNGTGADARLDGWSVAGKTGTAQKIDPVTRKYSPDKFVASFCGFVPAGEPRLTIVVIYDEPKGVSWGGYNAGPVFRNVAWRSLAYLGVPPTAEVRVAARRTQRPDPL